MNLKQTIFITLISLVYCQYQESNAYQQNYAAFPIQSQANYNQNSRLAVNENQEPPNEKLSDALDEIIGYLENENKNKKPVRTNGEYFERRKKNKQIDDDGRPLMDHRRKNGDLESERRPSNDKDTCTSKYSIETNKMIDSKTSESKGAKLIGVEKVQPTSNLFSLSDLQNSCMKLCCENELCESALLSLKIGEEGYRCYLFACHGHCYYVKHNDYVVLRVKSQEEVEGSLLANKDPNQVITTGYNPNKKCNPKYEFTCVKSGTCIAIYDVCDNIDHCDDKSDEKNCPNSPIVVKPKTTTNKAVVLNENKPVKSKDEPQKSKNKSFKQSDDVFDDLPSKSRLEDEEASEIDALLNTKQQLDAASDYGDELDQLKLIKQQNLIIEHLKELEEADLRQKSKNNKNKYNNKNNLDDIFDDQTDLFDSKINWPKKPATTSTKSTTKTKLKPIFHDDHNFVMNAEIMSPKPSDGVIKVDGYSEQDKQYFTNKDLAKSSSGNVSVAIILLVLGVSIVVAFFVYLILTTKYVSRRIKLFERKEENKNVEVDGDYLINGMYL